MTTTKNAVAEMIRAQLGRSLYMFGASNLLAGERDLSFKLGRNPKGATHVVITLATDDTYTVEVSKVRGYKITMMATLDGVQVSELASTIERHTGLYASL